MAPGNNQKNFRTRLDEIETTVRITERAGADIESAEQRHGLRRDADLALAGVKLALAYRKEIEKGNFSVFIPALAIALFKDGLLDEIPIIGTILGIFASVFLFFFLWGKGRWKVRLAVFILSFLDLIPGPNVLPMSTLAVLYAYHYCKKKAEKAEEKLKKLDEDMNRERAETRRQRARAGRRRLSMGNSGQQTVESEPRQEEPLETGAELQNQASPLMALSLATITKSGSYKQPNWMRDKKVDDAMQARRERMDVAERLGMAKEIAAQRILDLEKRNIERH